MCPGQVLNRCCVYAPDGSEAAHYDKIHLFAFDNGRESYDEGRTLQAGSTPVALDVSAGAATLRVGLSICYDLRFPELYRALMQPPCDLICVPAAFTYTTGRAHWELLLRARAVENQCYVLAAAQGGTHPNGRRTWGHSMVVDPWGEVLAVREEGEGVVIAELDPARIGAGAAATAGAGAPAAVGRSRAALSGRRTSSAAPASRFTGGRPCSAARPRPRAVAAPGSFQVKLRARKSVAAIIVQRSAARAHSARRSAASSVSAWRSTATSSWASRRPRFRPWPATGCSVCAALPMRTVAPLTSVRSAFRPSGKDFSGVMPTMRPASAREERVEHRHALGVVELAHRVVGAGHAPDQRGARAVPAGARRDAWQGQQRAPGRAA